MDGVGTPIIGRPRPLPRHDTPNPAYHPHTLNYEEPSTKSRESESVDETSFAVWPDGDPCCCLCNAGWVSILWMVRVGVGARPSTCVSGRFVRCSWMGSLYLCVTNDVHPGSWTRGWPGRCYKRRPSEPRNCATTLKCRPFGRRL